MSLVLDAVNTFFGHQHSQPTSSPQQHISQDPSRTHSIPHSKPSLRSNTPMSHNAPRASSSTATHIISAPQEHTQRQTVRASPKFSTHATPAYPEGSRVAESNPQLASTAPQTDGYDVAGDRHVRPRKVKVRDLDHIQQFATDDMDSFSEGGGDSQPRAEARENMTQYEISDMKVEHIIEMVAGLLTKITTTNDQQHEHLHRQPAYADGTSQLAPHTNSVLAFHGKNVPSITILSYLSRIHKYCPTSYEVFLSLLVYFDRMTERVNAGPMETLRQQQDGDHGSVGALATDGFAMNNEVDGMTARTPQGAQQATPPSSGNLEKSVEGGIPGTPHSKVRDLLDSELTDTDLDDNFEGLDLSHFFVVDSFNIHRLVIAGVTCASKFFSDIFYTNSRYAKVGGLPLSELNHLELQFLLLNDFRLSVPVEEIEAYGTMLVEFYAREVVAQRRASQAANTRSLSESSSGSASTVRS